MTLKNLLPASRTLKIIIIIIAIFLLVGLIAGIIAVIVVYTSGKKKVDKAIAADQEDFSF
jgi:flagellar basal body-associated protein FliL